MDGEVRWDRTKYPTCNKIFNCALSAEIIFDILKQIAQLPSNVISSQCKHLFTCLDWNY